MVLTGTILAVKIATQSERSWDSGSTVMRQTVNSAIDNCKYPSHCKLDYNDAIMYNVLILIKNGHELCKFDIQGVPIKNNPLGKIHYLSYYNIFFFTKFTAFTEEDSGHIHSKFC